MGYKNYDREIPILYSKKVSAGTKRTYFFDIKETQASGPHIVITESRKRPDGSGFERSSIFIFKEDLNKFMKGINDTAKFVKTELLANYDFSQFDFEEEAQNTRIFPREESKHIQSENQTKTIKPAVDPFNSVDFKHNIIDVEKW